MEDTNASISASLSPYFLDLPDGPLGNLFFFFLCLFLKYIVSILIVFAKVQKKPIIIQIDSVKKT